MAGNDKSKIISNALKINTAAVERKLMSFIRKNVRGAGSHGVVLGLSGGIDSSVTAALCAKALGPKKVIGVYMPEVEVSGRQDEADAHEIASKLGIDFRVVNITPVVKTMRQSLADYNPEANLPNANIMPRVRMMVLYYYANLLNMLVVGCGNRSELRTGYFTKFGDGASDMIPLGSLYKTQVRQLAAHLGIPKQIIDKPPTAALWKGQTDEAELGIHYKELDMIFAGLDLDLKPEAIAASAGVWVSKVKSFIERERRTLHKLRAPDIPKL